MGAFFLFLLLFFAVRALICFGGGRPVAGSFAVLACMLFAGGLYVDYASQHLPATNAEKPAI
jgi:hypothetical protein